MTSLTDKPILLAEGTDTVDRARLWCSRHRPEATQ
jgi:hypothetical protein